MSAVVFVDWRPFAGQTMSNTDGNDVPCTLLVVEDDADLAGLVRLRLEMEGYEVRVALSSTQALAAVVETPPTLMLLDLVLEEENGRDIIEALARRGNLPPFVVMTAHGDQQIAVDMMRLGARDYIIKDSGFVESLPRVVGRVIEEILTAQRLVEAEEELRHRNRLFQRLFNSVEDAFWITDWDTHETVYASPAYEEIWGIPRDVLYENPKAWADLIHPNDRRRAWDAFVKLSGEAAYDEEYRIVRPDGRTRRIRDRGFPVRDDDGKIYQVVGIAQDITDLRRSEEVERVLHMILHSAVEEPDLDTLLMKIRELLGALIDTTNFYVALYDSESDTYRFPFFADQREEVDPAESSKLPRSLTDFVRRTGEPALVDSTRFAELCEAREIELVGPDSAVWLGAPLNTDHGVIGVVAVQSYDDPSLYSQEDVELLHYAASTIAIAVERKRAEGALRESEAKLRDIVEHSTNLFFSHTADNVLTYLSPQCREILDCEPEEALVNWTEFVTDNPLNELGIEFTRRAIETGETQPPYELELLAKSGRRVWVEVREAPVVEDGTTVAIVGALTDITERRRAEAAQAASEARYRHLFERNVAGVYRATVDGRLVQCNQAVADMFGYASPEEALGANTEIHYQTPDVRARLLDELRNHGSVIGWEAPMRRRDGEPLWAVISANLIEDENGRPAIIEGSLIDISERRRLEQQLAQVQKLDALGQLAGGIAHDFNNLLMSISGSAELLTLRHSRIGDESNELMAIRETVKRGAELTRRLLAVAHQQVLAMEVINLRTVVEDELTILRRVIPENIEIDLQSAEDLPTVRADRGQLGQVLMNLVVNARDAMSKGGTIAISIEETVLDSDTPLRRPGVKDGAYACILIEDSGAGMDAATLTRIFEPFFTTKVQGLGTGMGLATVYGIIRQHGGFIEVESAPGEGSRFRVFLPTADGPVRKKSDLGEREAEGGTETILVVEDETAVRTAVVGMLEALGYTVVETTNGSEVLDVLRSGIHVDLVMSDVVMPTMGGRELLERARKLKPGLVVMFSSGYTDETLRDLLDTDKAASFIGKPYTMTQLARAVRQAMAGKEYGGA